MKSGAMELKDTTPTIVDLEESLFDTILNSNVQEYVSVSQLSNMGLTLNSMIDYQNAIKKFEFLIENINKAKFSPIEKAIIKTRVLYLSGILQREMGLYENAIKQFNQARFEPSFKQIPLMQQNILHYHILKNLGILYLKIKEYDNAVNYFEVALTLARALKKDALIPIITSYYGLAVVLQGNHNRGFSILKKARALYPKALRPKSLAWATHRYHMGLAYQDTGNFQDAILELETSSYLRQKINNHPMGSFYFHNRMGDCHKAIGQCYSSLKHSTSALKWLDKALHNYEAIDDKEKIIELQSQITKHSFFSSRALKYGITASVTLLGIGLFAYKLLHKKSAEDPNLLKKITKHFQ